MTDKTTKQAAEAAAAVPTPVPAPPGSGEVLGNDPFPKTAHSVEDTPPVRDNGSKDAGMPPAAFFDLTQDALAALNEVVGLSAVDEHTILLGRPETDRFLGLLPEHQAAEFRRKFALMDETNREMAAAGGREAWVQQQRDRLGDL
jgi:hypothetical protein